MLSEADKVTQTGYRITCEYKHRMIKQKDFGQI